MGFPAPPAVCSSPSEKDVEQHRATEKHIHFCWVKQRVLSHLMVIRLQTFLKYFRNQKNAKVAVSEAEKAAQEEPAKSRVSYGNEVRVFE